MSLDPRHQVFVRLPNVAEVGPFPLPEGPVLLPPRDETLMWSAQEITASNLHEFRCSPVGPCLGPFMLLADQSTEAVVQFARKWGPLGPVALACDPSNEEPDFSEMIWYAPPGRQVIDLKMPPEVLGTLGGNYEPVNGWRSVARWVTALLIATAKLSAGEQLTDEERLDAGAQWFKVERGVIDPSIPTFEPELYEAQSQSDRLLVKTSLALWARYANLIPAIQWSTGDSHPRLELPVPIWGGLPSRLGLELITIATSPTGIYRCDACGRMYSPARRARADRQRFCTDCSEGRSKAAKRAYYHRKKGRSSTDG